MGNICRAAKKKTSSTPDPNSFEARYSLVDHLGEGGFGEVYTCTDLVTGTTAAAKFVSNSNISEWARSDVERVPMEVKCLISCSHPNIISLLDYFVFNRHSVVVMEKPSSSVDLFNYTTYLGGISEQEARYLFSQLITALHYLMYNVRILHRDIKPENVLVDVRTRQLRIIDFGAATWYRPGTYTSFTGTRLYAPPEVILDGRYTGEALTVWSFGATLYFSLFSRHPFPTEPAILDGRILLPSPCYLSSSCLRMLELCLHPDPAYRSTVDFLMRERWLNERT